jgi:ubiquinone/menaquinone biosynthesis C-methylase UbiE
MTEPRFDRLAPHYAWIEAATFGGLLQWCRTALLDELTDARRVLVLGEGDGRFLAAFLESNRAATVDVIDASGAMIALAKRRIAPADSSRVQWHVADARRGEIPGASYDLIVTNFFLDCFPAAELEPLVHRLADRLASGGRWLVGDFARPDRPVPRFAANLALATMYLAFNLTTRIPASRLVNPRPLLQACGLELEREKHRLAGFLTASLWRRPSWRGSS